MTVEEKIDAIEKAKLLIWEARALVDAAVEDNSQIRANYEAYSRYGFYQLYGSLISLKEAFNLMQILRKKSDSK